MESNPQEEIKKAYVDSVTPELAQLRGRFGNFSFTKNKIQTHAPIINECMSEETKKLFELFAFLSSKIETCESADIFKKT